MLNWDILKNPLNWIIVLFMILIAGFVVEISCRALFGSKKSTPATSE